MAWPTTIDAAKGDVVARTPLHLVTFAFADGTYLRVATHAVTYGGQSYQARILNSGSNLGALSQLSQDGLDVVPQISLTLADSDRAMYARADKFFGARVTIDFVLWDMPTTTFSTDSYRVFTGRCGKPECTDLTLQVSATFILQLSAKKLPTFPVQQRCPKVQPTTTAEFALASDDENIPFGPCGLQASDFTGPCNQTREGCQANNHLLYFAGITYNVPDAGVTREYISGQKIDLRSNQNAAKYSDWVPIVLGTGWVDCLVTNNAPEANSTRGEAIVAEGISAIYKITCNDETLPAATDLHGNAYQVANALFRYNVLNDGSRSGRLNQDAFYSGNGDPYGSMAAIEWCVPRKVASDSGVPRVRALVAGKPIRVYSDANTFSKVYSDNPAWNILYVLARAGLSYSDVDTASFISAASYYSANVTYTDQWGNASATHPRYQVSMVIRQRTTAADVIAGLLRGCNSLLRWNSSTGKLQLTPKGTIGDQQASLPSGSNYSTPVISMHANGTGALGYVAYRFDASNILKDKEGVFGIRRLARGIADTPNAVSIQFTNSERDWVVDSLTTVDSAAINAAGQQIDANVKCDGVASQDQAKRVTRTFLDEIQADQWEIQSDGLGPVKLQTGAIVQAVETQKYSIDFYARVLKVEPSWNSETVKVTVSVHEDFWYADDNGQYRDGKPSNPKRNRLARPAYAWAPYEVQPPAGDAMFARTDWSFGIQAAIEDQFGAAKQSLVVTGKYPRNNPPGSIHPPMIGRQGTQGGSGSGFLKGGNTPHYFAVCAVDASGNEGMPSDLCQVVVSGAGSTYSATIPVYGWDSATDHFAVYGYHSTVGMTYLQDAAVGSSITVTAWNENSYGVPDSELNGILLVMRHVRHGGEAGQIVTAVGTNTVTLPGAGTGSYDWTGATLTLCAKDDRSPLPIWNATVVSNTGDVLTLSLDPTGVIAVNDVVLLNSPWTAAASPVTGYTRLTNVRWRNPLSNGGAGLASHAERHKLARVYAGTGRGQYLYIRDNGADWIDVTTSALKFTPDSTSRWIVEEPAELPENADVTDINNGDALAEFVASIPTDNYHARLVRVEGIAYDGGNNESPSWANPERLIWLLGDYDDRVQPAYSVSGAVTLQ